MQRTLSILKTTALAFAWFIGFSLLLEYLMRAPHNGDGFNAADAKTVLQLVALIVAIALAVQTRRNRPTNKPDEDWTEHP